jgi:predicted nucleic acid-binding protein
VTLLDAYALIAFVVGGPAAPKVRSLLRSGKSALAAANLVEVLDISQRIHNVPVARLNEVLDPLLDESISVLPLDRPIARRAAEIRARHYNRSSRPISLADAVLIGSAKPEDRIATADPDLLKVAEAEGIERIPLPPEG